MKTAYESFVEQLLQTSIPSRLLYVFVSFRLGDIPTPFPEILFDEHEPLHAGTAFSEVVRNADTCNNEWTGVLVAAANTKDRTMPTPEKAAGYLQMMRQKLLSRTPADLFLLNRSGQKFDPAQVALDLIVNEDRSNAIKWLERYIDFAPNSVSALTQLGELLRHGPRFKEAIKLFERALALNDNISVVWQCYATILVHVGRRREAQAAFERALRADDKNAEAAHSLGMILLADGETKAAIDLLEVASALCPNSPSFMVSYAEALSTAGRNEEASAAARSAIILDAEDHAGAAMILAKIGSIPVPLRASEASLQRMYRQHADLWDLNLTNPAGYRGARLVSDTYKTLASPQSIVLDAGCGTGLVGMLLSGQFFEIHGVDISKPMLAKAGEKRIYTGLHESDLETFMATHRATFDVVTCAATLIHFGDLASVFAAAKNCLRDSGRFMFTVFPDVGDGYSVNSIIGSPANGLFQHSESYVTSTAQAAGFSVERASREIHEFDTRGEAIECLLFSLIVRDFQ